MSWAPAYLSRLTAGPWWICGAARSLKAAHPSRDTCLTCSRLPRARPRYAPIWPPIGSARVRCSRGATGPRSDRREGRRVGLDDAGSFRDCPDLRAPLKNGAFYDFDHMVDCSSARAFWKPGTRNGYHGITSAWTVARWCTAHRQAPESSFAKKSRSRSTRFLDWLAGRAGASGSADDFAPITDEVRNSRISQAASKEKDSATHYFMFNNGGFNPNSREGHAAEIGSANGISNARGLAAMYAPLANGGELNGVRLVGRDTLTRMSLCSVATHEDATLRIPTRFSLGYMKAMDNRRLENAKHCSLIISDRAFGHVGAGGSIGFADPDCHMSFGYSMNRMGFGILMNDRGQS